VTARVSSCLHAFKVHREITERYIAHLDHESGTSGKHCLLKGHIASESGFNGKTLAAFDPTQDERLEFAVDEPSNLACDADI
jgi:hypothetical protein